jgi:hypothetical protein
MPMQARLSENDPRFYNTSRDVAHCFAAIAEEVAGRLEDGRWPVLQKYLDDHGITDEQLGEACAAFCQFVVSTCDNPEEGMGDLLHRVGWHSVPEPAQVAVCSILGTVMMGCFFRGARDVTIGFEGPCADLRNLAEAGREAHEWLTMPRWKRWVYRKLLRRKGLNGEYRK